MGMTIQQAADFSNRLFLDPRFIKEGQFDIARLKALPQEQRKICFNALDMLEKAQLTDWNKEAPENKLGDEVFTAITNVIEEDPDAKQPVRYSWYKSPFIWIAKIVNRFFKWFKNTFLGRIGLEKIYDKVECFRQDFELKKNERLNTPEQIKELETKLSESILEITKINEGIQREAKNLFVLEIIRSIGIYHEVISIANEKSGQIAESLMMPSKKIGEIITECLPILSGNILGQVDVGSEDYTNVFKDLHETASLKSERECEQLFYSILTKSHNKHKNQRPIANEIEAYKDLVSRIELLKNEQALADLKYKF